MRDSAGGGASHASGDEREFRLVRCRSSLFGSDFPVILRVFPAVWVVPSFPRSREDMKRPPRLGYRVSRTVPALGVISRARDGVEDRQCPLREGRHSPHEVLGDRHVPDRHGAVSPCPRGDRHRCDLGHARDGDESG
jgi:hypothetical protein